jgi:hypothetical protein
MLPFVNRVLTQLYDAHRRQASQSVKLTILYVIDILTHPRIRIHGIDVVEIDWAVSIHGSDEKCHKYKIINQKTQRGEITWEIVVYKSGGIKTC